MDFLSVIRTKHRYTTVGRSAAFVEIDNEPCVWFLDEPLTITTLGRPGRLKIFIWQCVFINWCF